MNERLKQIRIRNKLSMEKMARELNISYNNYFNCEKGKAVLNIYSLTFLVEKFGVDANWFLTGIIPEKNNTVNEVQLENVVEIKKVNPKTEEEEIEHQKYLAEELRKRFKAEEV